MGIDSSPEKAIIFYRTKKCLICSLFSVGIKPGMYYVSRESTDVIVTSNNPNQVLQTIDSTTPAAKALAIDTSGFSVNEAIAFGKIDLRAVEDQISRLTAQSKGLIFRAPRNLIDQFTEFDGNLEISDPDNVKGLQTNKKLHRLLIRLLTGLRLGLAYSFLIAPLLLINVRYTFKSILIFTGTMVLGSAIFPKKRLVNLFSFLLIGALLSFVSSLENNSSIDIIFMLLNLLIGTLWGFLAWIILNR